MRTLLHSTVLLMLALTVLGFSVSAQKIQDPTDWKFSVKKQDATHYTLVADVAIQPKWHIYAINPGGEGELIGTSFHFEKGLAQLSGEVKEVTPAKQEVLMDEKVNLHSGKATFSVKIIGRQGQMLSGTVEYQACNDMMCLPPKKKLFSVKLP
jgi:thiol:disulfide interchange protein DsbD